MQPKGVLSHPYDFKFCNYIYCNLIEFFILSFYIVYPVIKYQMCACSLMVRIPHCGCRDLGSNLTHHTLNVFAFYILAFSQSKFSSSTRLQLQ